MPEMVLFSLPRCSKMIFVPVNGVSSHGMFFIAVLKYCPEKFDLFLTFVNALLGRSCVLCVFFLNKMYLSLAVVSLFIKKGKCA